MSHDHPLSSAFRQAFRRHPVGVAILTAEGPDGPLALTVSSLVSVCAAPPVVAFSLSAASRSAAGLLKAGTLVIHFPRHAHQDLARLCATPGGDRFGSGVDWERLPTGEPRYRAVTTWFRAQVRDVVPVEGATLVTAVLLEGEVEAPQAEADALVYLDRAWHGLAAPG